MLVLLAAPFLVAREWALLPDWTEIAALALLAAPWLVRKARTGRWSVSTAIDVPTLALLLTLPLAIWAAWDGHRPAAISRAESLLLALAMGYAIANWLTTRRRAWLAAAFIILLGMTFAAAGLLTVDWVAKYPVFAPALDYLPRAVSTVPHATLRTPAHPNQLGGLLAMTLAFAVALLLDRHPPRFVRQASWLAVALLGPVLLVTQSRTSWTALALSVGAMVWLRWSRGDEHGRPRRRALQYRIVIIPAVLSIALMVALAPAVYSLVSQRGLSTTTDSVAGLDQRSMRFSAVSRVYLWRDSVRMLEERPVTGIGLHNFVWRQGNRMENEGLLIYPGFSHSHNLWLQAALDYGLPGAAAFGGIVAALAWAAADAHRRLQDTEMYALVIGAFGGLMVWGLHGLTDAIAVGSKVGLLPWSLCGLLIGLQAHARSLRDEPGAEGAKRSRVSPKSAATPPLDARGVSL